MLISLTAALIFIIDRLTKIWAQNAIPLGGSHPVISNIFHLTLVHNKGVAFGFFSGMPLLVFISVLFIVVIAFVFAKYSKEATGLANRLSIGLLLGGALGNLYDRVVFGHVVDFLDFRIWPVFNAADSAITVGAVILGISMMRKR